MGEFTVGNKNNPTDFINLGTHWKRNGNTFTALVERAQLTTPAGITLTFKQGSLLTFFNDGSVCVYTDDNLL